MSNEQDGPFITNRQGEAKGIRVGMLFLSDGSRDLRSTVGGAHATLAPIERGVFVFLARRAGEVCPRGALIAAVWGEEAIHASNALDVHVAGLRKKLRKVGGVKIETVRGEGYRLVTESTKS